MAKELVFKLKVVDETGNIVEKTIDNVNDLKKAQKSLSDQLEKAPIGSARFKELKGNLEAVEKAQTKASVAQKGFLGTLKEIPGPIGSLAQGVGGLNKAFLTLVANPIGATIAALGVIFTTVTKAINSTEDGSRKLNVVMGAFKGILDPILKTVGELANVLVTGLVSAIEKAIAVLKLLGIDFATAAEDGMKLAQTMVEIEEQEGKLAMARAEQNKVLAEARAILSDSNATLEERRKALEKVKEEELKTANQELDLAKKTKAALEEKIRLEGESRENKKALEEATIALSNAETEYNNKIRLFNKEEKRINSEEEAARKERLKAAEDRRKKEEEILDKIRAAREANNLASITDDRKREEEKIRLQEESAKREIAKLETTEANKKILREQAEEATRLALADIAKKYDEKEKEKTKKNEEDLANLKGSIRDAEANTEEERRALELQKVQEYYDQLIAKAKEAGLSTEELAKSQGQAINDLNQRFREEDVAREFAATQAKMQMSMQYAATVAQIGQILSSLAGESKTLATLGVMIEKASSISKIVSATKVANAGALATPQAILTGGLSAAPVITANNISAGVGIAAVIASALQAISQINASPVPKPVSDNIRPEPTPPNKFEKGGRLRGPSHAQGGILTPFGELEGGEFIVNKFATQAFLPMLEQINRNGQSGMEPTQPTSMAPQMLKTYVVASDLDTELEKRKKLRDLARL